MRDDAGKKLTKLDRRVKARREEQRLIVSEFMEKSTRQYDLLLKAVQTLGPKLGREIPLSDKLGELRNAMQRLGSVQLGVVNVDLALLGVASEAMGRETKDLFVGALRRMVQILDELMGMELYRGVGHDFAAMRGALDGLIRIIDLFSDVISKKLGAISPEEKKQGGADPSIWGSPDVGLAKSPYKDMPLLARSEYDLDRAINTFLYFFYIAKVRVNLTQTGKELVYYGEGYADLLGDAVAMRIQNLLSERQDAVALEQPFLVGPEVKTTAPDAAYQATFKTFRDKTLNAKISFYRALQAIDLYMKAFTDGIVTNPDDVSDIRRIIEGYEVIGPWFTAQTGEYLADAFDLMPNGGGKELWPGDATQAAATYPTVADPDTDGHYYTKIAGRLGEDPKTIPGVPFLPLTTNPGAADGGRVAKVENLISQAIDNFQALKNLVNAFVRIGDKFGGTELRRQVFMSPGEIYRALHDYLKHSALSCGTVSAAGPTYTLEGGTALKIPMSGYSDANMAWGAGVFFGMADVGAATITEPAQLQGNFVVEDRYLSFCVKAMGAKVLTVLGVYDLFERPKPIYQLTPVRMIIGGSDGFGAPPPVIAEAAELYFRLPRLAEFYQDLFKASAPGGADQIALLPELEGVFAGIMRLIFLRSGLTGQDYSAIGVDYSESEVQSLVREINKIYEVFRGIDAEKPVSAALSAFVMEVNRHYGVVKADELKKMYDLYSQRWRLEGRGAGNDAKANIRNMFGKLNPTDYAILPDETDTYSRSSAPSDRWALSGKLAAKVDTPLTLRKSDNKLDDSIERAQWIQWKLLATFRKTLDNLLDVKSAEGFEELRMTSYSRRITVGEEEMRDGRDAEAKLGVAAKLIQGTGIGMTSPGADVDAGKAFMFHETVGVGLNTLGALYTELVSVRQRIQALALKPLREALKQVLAAPPAAPQLTDATSLREAVIAKAITNGLKYLAPNSLDRYLVPLRPVAGQGGADPASPLTYEAFWTEYSIQLAAGGVMSDGAQNTAAEIFFDQPAMMEDLVVLLQGLTATYKNLVTLRFPGTTASQVILDFGGLRGAVQRLMADVRGFLDFFRPFLSAGFLAVYEAGEQNGSLYWLERRLVDELVRGFPSEQEAQEVKNREANDLEGMARSLNDTFVALTEPRKFCLATWPGAAAAGVWTDTTPAVPTDPVALATWQRTQYGDVFCRLAFYSPQAGGDAPTMSELAADWVGVGIGQELGSLFTPRPGPGASPGPTPAMWAAGDKAPPAFRLNLFSKWGLVTGARGSRSLLFIFNQILGGYLSAFYDPSSQKIYRTLIEGFALGSFSQAVMYPGFALPDLIAGEDFPAGDTNWGIRGDPQTVLLQSLAYLLNVLTTRQNLTPPGPAHLSSTLSDVPPYVHESYRANLPTYVKLFDTVSQYGEILKMVMSQTNLSDTRLIGGGGLARLYSPLVAATVGGVVPANATVATFGATPVAAGGAAGGYAAGDFTDCLAPIEARYYTSTAAMSMVTQVVDNIVAACYTMGNCALEVLRELADNDPLYLQGQKDSIGEYKTRWGKLPLMPLSLALTALKPSWQRSVVGVGAYPCDGRSTTSTLWPGFRIGQAGFKLAYGTRKLFGRPKSKFELSDAPGVRSQLEAFNATLGGGRSGLPLDRYDAFLQNEVALLRFSVDFVCIAGSFAPEGWSGCVFRPLLYAPTAAAAAAETQFGGPVPVLIGDVIAVYPLTLTEAEVMAIPESSYQDQEIKKFTASLGKKGASTALGAPTRDKAGARRAEWLSNIIDMNIMPINVHALMRGIPLAPLYNYAYTFEQLTCLMFGLAIEARRPEPNGPPKVATTTREMFVDLLLDPYMEVQIEQYGASTAVYNNPGANGLVWRIFRGDDSLMMGRPKFLSDQLFNKALFGTLYDIPFVFEETGPAGAGRMSRGRQKTLATGWAPDAANPLGAYPWNVGPGTPNYAALNATAGVKALASSPQSKNNFGLLTFPPNEGKEGIMYADPGSTNALERMRNLEAVGKARFDTRLVRNLVFITNVQRVLRLRLSQELTEYRNVLAKSHSAVNPGITEYGTIPAGALMRGYPAGPQETAKSRRYDNEQFFFAQ